MKYILFNDLNEIVTRYDVAIHGDSIPKSAVEVDDETFWKTINEQDGIWKLRRHGAKNFIEKHPFPAPSQEEIDAIALAHATDRFNKEMAVANEAVVALQDMVDADLAKTSDKNKLKAWKAFRVGLRSLDLKDKNAEWPTRPE
jgi:hypothetical protein